MEHETGEHDEVQPHQDYSQPLVVARQTTEARCPSEIALHDPALGQEDEAALGLRQLDHAQFDAPPRQAAPVLAQPRGRRVARPPWT